MMHDGHIDGTFVHVVSNLFFDCMFRFGSPVSNRSGSSAIYCVLGRPSLHYVCFSSGIPTI